MKSVLVILSPFVAIGLFLSIYTTFHPVHAQKNLSNAKAPANPPTPSQEEEKSKVERPFYGTTLYSGVLSSLYFYPQGDSDHVGTPVSHLKFNFSDERDLWICGDVRSKFTVGRKVSLVISYEPNTPCVTNFKSR